MTAITIKDWMYWVRSDEKSIIYAKGPCGYLAKARMMSREDMTAKRIAFVANEAACAERSGLVSLVQRRDGNEIEYIAIRRGRK